MKKSYIAAFSYSLVVGLSFLVTKLVVPHASSNLILAHRFTIAFIGYGLMLILRGEKLQFTKKKVLKILPLTVFYPLLFFSFQVYGLNHATSSEAGIIFALVPILVIMIGALTKNIPNLSQTVSIVLSVTGVLVIFSRNTASFNGNTEGIVLLFLSALSSAIYTIVLKKMVSKVNIHELTFLIILVGFMLFNLMSGLELYQNQSHLRDYAAPFESLHYVFGIIYLGLFASVGASFASNYAIQKLSAPQFSVFSNLSTLISIVAGGLILKESLSVQHYLGSLLILIGVIGVNFSHLFDDGFILSFKRT